jgi:lysozyme
MVKTDLKQNEFDSLVSWVFNLGPSNLSSSTLLQKLNNKDWNDVPNQIKRWNKAGGQVKQGLIRRREAEALLFQGQDWSDV